MSQVLMPIATAKWLIDNTTLTFEQIADFCGLHLIEVQAIADNETGTTIKPLSPLYSQLTQEEIDRCVRDSNAKLNKLVLYQASNKKNKKYISKIQKDEKAEGIFWILRNHPEVQDIVLVKFFKTTKTAINSLRAKLEISQDITYRSPVILGLCMQQELENIISQSAHEIEN